MIFTQIYHVKGLETIENSNINKAITNINIEENKIYFESNNENYVYDLDKDTLSFDNTTVYFNTKVEYINPDLKISVEKALNLEKEMIKENFKKIAEKNNRAVLLKSSLDPVVPSNAPYKVAVKFSKNIASIKADFDKAVAQFVIGTGVLKGLAAIAKVTLKAKLAAVLGVTTTVAAACQLEISGTWKYNLEMTKSMYPAGNTKQYCYRYAHSALVGKASIKPGKTKITKNFSFAQNGKGKWWVSQKPY